MVDSKCVRITSRKIGLRAPIRQSVEIGRHVLGKRLCEMRRCPLGLMLELLFECNLGGAGWAKIDYPNEILSRA